MTRCGIFAGGIRRAGSVELVRVATPCFERLLERGERMGGLRRVGQAEPDGHRLAGTNFETVMSGGLGPDLRRADRIGLPVHDERVKGVFDVGAGIGHAEETLGIRVILGEQ